MSKRTFYRTVVQIEILSEDPYSSTDLEKINDDITNGAQSGLVSIVIDSEEMDGKTCVKKLKEQGTEPEFFWLDVNGHDTDDIMDDFQEDEEEEMSGPRKLRKE